MEDDRKDIAEEQQKEEIQLTPAEQRMLDEVKARNDSAQKDGEEAETASPMAALKKDVLETFTSDEEEETHVNWSLSRILGGDIINIGWFRKHAGLILLILVFSILYISNRYASQQEIIRIDKLKKELTDKRIEALTRSSQLLEKCRQSSIIDYLKTTSDSAMEISTVPPYVITVSNSRK